MPAGSVELAYAVEESYRELPASPVWKQPGENLEIGGFSLENNMDRAQQPDQRQSDGAREGRLTGTIDLTWALTDTNFHEFVFPEGNNTELGGGATRWPTVTWYLKLDRPGGAIERFLDGSAPESVTWNLNSDGDVTVNATMRYAFEPEVGGTHGDAPTAISQPSKSDIVRWHGGELQLDAATVSDIQSASFTVSNLVTYGEGQSRVNTKVEGAAFEGSANIQADIEDNTQLQYAYGSDTATEPADQIAEVNGSLSFDNPAGKLVEYDLQRMQPTSYEWADVLTDTFPTDPTEYTFSNMVVV